MGTLVAAALALGTLAAAPAGAATPAKVGVSGTWVVHGEACPGGCTLVLHYIHGDHQELKGPPGTKYQAIYDRRVISFVYRTTSGTLEWSCAGRVNKARTHMKGDMTDGTTFLGLCKATKTAPPA